METTGPQDDTEQFERLRADLSWKKGETQDEFLERYANLTDTLIDSMLAFDTDEQGNEVPADYVIFLDKSARPLAWMTRELWPQLAQDDEGKTPEMPQMRFLNIDRMPWRVDPDVEIATHRNNFRTPSDKDIEGLRAIFAVPGKTAGDTSPLDGKRILVVDEVSDSGDTMYAATSLLASAFPEAEIKGHNWMNEYEIAHDGSKRVIDVPVWYEKDKETGRGVLGQQTAASPFANKKSALTAESHQFLSTRPNIPSFDHEGGAEVTTIDQRALALRRDIAKMALRLASGKLAPIPSTRHQERYLGMPMDQYAKHRRETHQKRKSL